MPLSSHSEAERKFWQNPELVDGFLQFLDPAETLQLALAHKKTRSILKGSRAWRLLIQRNSPLTEQDVDHLVAILMLKKDARDHILDVLHSICETNTPTRESQLHIGCPNHAKGHSVSQEGFRLLEKVESTFGTTLLTVEHVFDDLGGVNVLSILGSRLSRQQKRITFSHIKNLVLSTEKEAENFLVLVGASSLTTIGYLEVEPSVGRHSLGLLAQGLHCVTLGLVDAQRKDLESGSREDLRILWNALGWHDGHLLVTAGEHFQLFAKSDGEASWNRLSHIMDLSEEEWIRQECECPGCYLDAIANNEYDDTDDDTNDDTTEDDA